MGEKQFRQGLSKCIGQRKELGWVVQKWKQKHECLECSMCAGGRREGAQKGIPSAGQGPGKEWGF